MHSELFPWKYLEDNFETIYEILAKIQFPWRMLEFAVLFLSVVTGIVITTLFDMRKKDFALAIIFISAFLMVECMDGYLTDGEVLVSKRSQYIPTGNYEDYYRSDFLISEWDTTLQEADHIIVQKDSDIEITDYRKNGINLQFSFSRKDTSQSTILNLPLYNYFLHSARLNGEDMDIETGINGRIAVTIPEGTGDGNIVVRYTGRKLYCIGDMISLVGVAGTVGYYILVRRKRNRAGA